MAKKDKKQGIEINVGVCEQTFKKLKVEKRHISNGEQGSADSCPIALAVREALGPDGKDADIHVGLGGASFTIKRDITVPIIVCGKERDQIVKTIRIEGELHLSKKADAFIETFDGEEEYDEETGEIIQAGGKNAVKPTTFTGKPVIDISID